MGVYAGIEKTWASQTNTGRTHIATKGIVQSGLVLNLDAGASTSYPGSGTTWTDLTGNSNTGTLTNGPTYSSANGGSIVFDGTNDYVTLGTSLTNGYINITVSAWFYAVADTGRQDIVTKYPFGNGWLLYYSNTTNNFGVDGRESEAQYFSNVTTNTYAVNNWYNVVFTKNTTNWRLYINSLLDCNNTNGNGTTSFNNAGILAIGSLPANSDYAKGNIAQVSIYNRALSAAEVSQNFNALRNRFGI
jgi:hypothetical protein